MGLRASGIASDGMFVSATAHAVAADNIANVLTPGFRPSSVGLGDVAAGGVRLTETPQQPQAGALVLTGNPLDMAIGGAGFFIVNDERGPLLTRNGSFHLDADGALVDAQGRRVRPGLSLPQSAIAMTITRQGDIFAATPGGMRNYVGTLELGTVGNPRGLRADGENAWRLTPASGMLLRGTPGGGGFGVVVQGGLEASATDLLESGLSGILASRAFSANAAVTRTTSAIGAELAAMVEPAEGGKRRRPTGSIDLKRSQASRLVEIFGRDEPGGRQPIEQAVPDVRARLSARQLTAPDIAELYRVRGKYQPERFPDSAGGVRKTKTARRKSDKIVLEQELLIARRQAAETLLGGSRTTVHAA